MWRILLWCRMTPTKHYRLSKREFYKGQNWNINGRFLDRTRFLQLSWAYIAGLDWQTLNKHIHRSTEPVIVDLWLAFEPCQTVIIRYQRNVAYSLRAGDNSASAVKHRPRKHSAILNGAWTPCILAMKHIFETFLVHKHIFPWEHRVNKRCIKPPSEIRFPVQVFFLISKIGSFEEDVTNTTFLPFPEFSTLLLW